MLQRLARQGLRCNVGRMPALHRYSISRIILAGAGQPPTDVSSSLPPSSDVKPADTQTAPVLLYEKKNYTFHHMMFAVTGINCMIWSSQLATYLALKSAVTADIDMSGDPKMAGAGMFFTLVLMYFTRVYGHCTIYKAHLVNNGNQIAFQTHTAWSSPGETFTVNVNKVRFIDKNLTKEKILAPRDGIAKILPKANHHGITVEGRDKNLIVDDESLQSSDWKLFDLLAEVEAPQRANSAKSRRADWRADIKSSKGARN